MSKEKLLGKTPEELKEVVASVGLPADTAKQRAEWIYVKRVNGEILVDKGKLVW